ncbi:MAG TPA: DUF1272 domain-containing protein [Steroidobacteraceae bacterium]|jgi:hypothetical protein|nr:DUF1272 domain-containing protein [Steroidobacteraceae bacterium]
MLILKPGCECCNRDLPPDSRDAWICSFECTFCTECVERRLDRLCPNCGGEFVRRPIRPAAALRQYPPSRDRVFKPHGCVV